MRAPLIVLLASIAFAACGATDELQQFRDTADDAVQSVRDGVPTEQLREELDQVREDLESSDLPDDARRELENARDELERAIQ